MNAQKINTINTIIQVIVAIGLALFLFLSSTQYTVVTELGGVKQVYIMTNKENSMPSFSSMDVTGLEGVEIVITP